MKAPIGPAMAPPARADPNATPPLISMVFDEMRGASQ
jgi:hypothetical protein